MMNIIRVHTAGSTNEVLKELSTTGSSLPEGTIVVAETQTAGRGQKGTDWESEAGKNLTFSLLLYPTFLPVQQHFLLSEIVVLGVQETLNSLRPALSFTIKWPNDVYCGHRKIV
jgi:BirA family biotin operon repressor/biotin-[acetyl-CoA-carboxylase] ligase